MMEMLNNNRKKIDFIEVITHSLPNTKNENKWARYLTIGRVNKMGKIFCHRRVLKPNHK